MNSTSCAKVTCIPFSAFSPNQTPNTTLILRLAASKKKQSLTMLALCRLRKVGHEASHACLTQAFCPPSSMAPISCHERGSLSSHIRDLVRPSWPSFPSTSQSPKVLNLVISSSISCRSTSVILFVRLGINVFASSAVSQHKLAAPRESSAPPRFRNPVEMSERSHT